METVDNWGGARSHKNQIQGEWVRVASSFFFFLLIILFIHIPNASFPLCLPSLHLLNGTLPLRSTEVEALGSDTSNMDGSERQTATLTFQNVGGQKLSKAVRISQR